MNNSEGSDAVAADGRRDGAQAVGRAIDVLLAVARLQWRGATLQAITQAVELNRSTCFRLVRYLVQRGLLEFERESGSYFIGRLAYELGLAARAGGGLISSWQPCLDRIRSLTGMTAYLVARSGLDVVCLAVAEAATVVRAVPLKAGQRLPLGIGAGSLAILSSCPDEEVDAILAANAGKLKDYGGGIAVGNLRESVRRTRHTGYAISSETVARGVRGLGLTVPSDSAQLAVSVSSTKEDFDSRDLSQILDIIRKSSVG